jgi:hypothetical protein
MMTGDVQVAVINGIRVGDGQCLAVGRADSAIPYTATHRDVSRAAGRQDHSLHQ